MSTELKIVWDGNVPGLAEHRLSLSAFGESLILLLKAYRRIATNLLSDAIEEEEPSAMGRLANPARQLDIEIARLEEGSTGVVAVCTFQPAPTTSAQLLGTLAAVASLQLLEAIEQESTGHLRHATVRKYLNSLPSGVRHQSYSLNSEEHKLQKTVVVENMNLPQVPAEMPYLAQYNGNIIGVGFEPGKTEIRIKGEGPQVSLKATPEQVELALELRNTSVRALVIISDSARLLRLEAANAPSFEVNADQISRHIFEKWDGLLRRLAQ